MFSILSRTNFAIWITFNLRSADILNLDWSKILSFGKGLNPRYCPRFVIVFACIRLWSFPTAFLWILITNHKILAFTKLIAFVYKLTAKFKVANMMISVFQRVENIVGKEENAG